MDKRGKGYIERSLSVNAHTAYLNGEKPLKEWEKKVILHEISVLINHAELVLDQFEKLKNMPGSILRKLLLYKTGYHHIGEHREKVDFYSLNLNVLSIIDDLNINYIDLKGKEKKKKKEDQSEDKEASLFIDQINRNDMLLPESTELMMTKALETYKYEQHLSGLLPLTQYTTIKGLKRAINNDVVDIKKLEHKFMIQKLEWLLPKTKHRNMNTLLNAVVSNGISIVGLETSLRQTDNRKVRQVRKTSKKQVFMSHAGNIKADYGFQNVKQMWQAYVNGRLRKNIIRHLNSIQNHYVF